MKIKTKTRLAIIGLIFHVFLYSLGIATKEGGLCMFSFLGWTLAIPWLKEE